jgi:hypothetical protein
MIFIAEIESWQLAAGNWLLASSNWLLAKVLLPFGFSQRK